MNLLSRYQYNSGTVTNLHNNVDILDQRKGKELDKGTAWYLQGDIYLLCIHLL